MEGINKLPDIMTIKQLAEALQITELTIRRVLYKGELKGFKVGREWRLDKNAVKDWLEIKQ